MSIQDNSIDVLACQQGIQFFPDKKEASYEMYRVLKEGSNLFVSTWCPVNECIYFGAICTALESIEETNISSMMRIPFDHFLWKGLKTHSKWLDLRK